MDTVRHTSWQVLTKVPKVTIYFWIIKILTTAAGESISDLLVNQIDPYIAVGIGTLLLVLCLLLQFRVRAYIPSVYWLAALAVSIAGTMGADVVHVALHVPYVVSTLFCAGVLFGIFLLWYKREKTLSIHSIYTKKREAFYWATVLATFALGTATGDLTAYGFHLGFLDSGILFVILFILPGVAFWLLRANAIATFWIAYILTRPLGASFADWFGKAQNMGGIGLGDAQVSIVLIGLIILIVGYLSFTHRDFHSNVQV